MNLSRNPCRGSDSSRDLAYSSQSADSGKPCAWLLFADDAFVLLLLLLLVFMLLVLMMTGVGLLSRMMPGAITGSTGGG